MKIAVFGHDAGDAALAKRIGQMRAEGHDVRALTLRRGQDTPRAWPNTDLGRTRDAAFVQRLAAIVSAVPTAARALGAPDVVWARNLDAALIARAALAAARCHAPLIYECLDIHDLASGQGPASRAVRALERSVLARAALTVVSSPAFVTAHFERHYGDLPLRLVENRLAREGLPARPSVPQASASKPIAFRPDRPLTIGLFGVLRCRRSVSLLLDTANAMDGALRVVFAGRCAQDQLPDFAAMVAASPHADDLGPYEAPSGLAALYAQVDLVWAGDWFQAGANSRWLLPNRLYEGGWFGVPALAPAGTQTAAWAVRHGTGLAVPDPAEKTLPALLSAMTPDRLAGLRASTLAAPDALFAAPPGEITQVLNSALGPDPSSC